MIINGATLFRPVTSIEVAVGVASAQSAALSALCGAVRLVSTTACRVAFGATGALPTATATSMLLSPNVPENFVADPNCVVAVIQEAAGGKLSVTEIRS